MLFEFDKHRTKISAQAMAQQSLAERQRDIYESHRHRVFSLSYYMTGSEIEAEDLLQGTFISAFRKADEPDQATIDGTLIDHMKSHMLLEEEESVPVPTAEASLGQRNILRADLEEAIRCLPATERLVFLLMDVEGYSSARIASLLRMSEAEVRRTAIFARLRLRNELAAAQQDGCQAA
ncbi:MAG: sigma-70 family RNA polymerase sigma factor [Acidobacteriaceae bacterium]